MNVENLVSDFVKKTKPYAFAEVDKTRDKLKTKGVDVIDFGVGDPTDPTPEIVREACKEGLDKRAKSGYPSYEGSIKFRTAVSKWFKKRFGVNLDPKHEITATIGSKQAVFSFHSAFVNPRDVVLIPDPGYPPYTTGTRHRYGKPVFMPIIEENYFLPDLEVIDSKGVKMMWINYPNNPTTKIAPKEKLKEIVDFCSDNNILLVSDEAYSEMYYDEKPISILGLEAAREVSLVFNSLSKRSNMTGYRIGFAAGRKDLLKPFKKVQTQMHSGVATFIQDAAIAALSDEKHVENMRSMYRKKRDILTKALINVGFQKCYAEGTFYIWAKVPDGYSSTDTTKNLLEKAGLNTTPRNALSQELKNGEGFVRFALVPSIERTKEAAERLGKISLSTTTH